VFGQKSRDFSACRHALNAKGWQEYKIAMVAPGLTQPLLKKRRRRRRLTWMAGVVF
jgi:hypothetical protein